MKIGFGVVLFVAVGLLCQALALLTFYEAYSVGTGQDPTLSKIVAYTLAHRPVTWVVAVFTTGAIFGALVTHFTNWNVR